MLGAGSLFERIDASRGSIELCPCKRILFVRRILKDVDGPAAHRAGADSCIAGRDCSAGELAFRRCAGSLTEVARPLQRHRNRLIVEALFVLVVVVGDRAGRHQTVVVEVEQILHGLDHRLSIAGDLIGHVGVVLRDEVTAVGICEAAEFPAVAVAGAAEVARAPLDDIGLIKAVFGCVFAVRVDRQELGIFAELFKGLRRFLQAGLLKELGVVHQNIRIADHRITINGVADGVLRFVSFKNVIPVIQRLERLEQAHGAVLLCAGGLRAGQIKALRSADHFEEDLGVHVILRAADPFDLVVRPETFCIALALIAEAGVIDNRDVLFAAIRCIRRSIRAGVRRSVRTGIRRGSAAVSGAGCAVARARRESQNHQQRQNNGKRFLHVHVYTSKKFL